MRTNQLITPYYFPFSVHLLISYPSKLDYTLFGDIIRVTMADFVLFNLCNAFDSNPIQLNEREMEREIEFRDYGE